MPSKPRPVVEVPAKTCKARRSVEPREYRDRAAHMRVEVTLWALPIGTQKAVNTIGRNRNGMRGNGADGHLDFAQRREGRAIYLEYFGKVVLHQNPGCSASYVKMTTRSRATRRSSASPWPRRGQ